ncbi:asparagine synthetase domain-containing protein 1 [Sesamum indicum]|uniref:Asparagine synthetase domain-containing protein 1 n=1 Tax=Sesamum indicum TaxID=4182 RepID=A0A6I9UQ34_SESIN|nr:asparagine synthetase domain-containing protein 1 [Sesamum indicum]
MCGIALIISGIKIDLSHLVPSCTCPSPQFQEGSLFSEEDIKEALQRRGPDSLGAKKVYLYSEVSDDESKDCIVQSFVQKEAAVDNGCGSELRGELRFIGATLQLRGVNPVVQPLTDAFGNVLVYNGEIFGGINFSRDSNDTEVLMQSLGQCCSCISHEHSRSFCHFGEHQKSVPELLSTIRGPWALIYWQDSSKTLWFGRDALGRRSLLVHWPTCHDSRLLLSSVSPLYSSQQQYDISDEKGKVDVDFWEELSCGVYSISMSPSEMDGHLIGKLKKHEWTDCELKELMMWERTSIEPIPENLSDHCTKVPTMQQDMLSSCSSELGYVQSAPLTTSHKVMMALRESVVRRTTMNRIYQAFPVNQRQERYAPVAVLFSGGLDSMIIAALLHQCIDSEYDIDLLNVSFDGVSAPDRISARAGLKELKKIAPLRRWNLIEIDADLRKLTSETKHVMALINPANTYMDLNIGIALWLAAGGDGWLYEETSSNGRAQCLRVKYKSEARILLVGSGADEQCAGYGRHRTKYRNRSWLGLHEEMKLDMQRIWKRNLGRDDRCIADNGKEARFPFLDEDVIRTLLDIPLWEIADLNQPSGVGDKKILREVARLLGLKEAASLPKRAIQFGSRIARESNRKNFGSNRAANQASAGSVVIYGSSD